MPVLLAAVACQLSGCASAPVRTPTVEVRAEAPPLPRADAAMAAAPAAPLPDLPVTQTAVVEHDARRIDLDVSNAEVRGVVRQIAEQYGLALDVDPQLQGAVSARLQNATMTQALDAVLAPRGYSYAVQQQVLRVTKSRMETRIFAVDYIALSRNSLGITALQRSLNTGQNGQNGFGGGGVGGAGGSLNGINGSSSIITTVEGADLWNELRVAMRALVFHVGEEAAPAGAPGTAAGGIGNMLPQANAPGAFSQVGEDGTMLIINPLAGQITVTAPPAVLAQVGTYLDAFEASVRRQVLIEAKIVEVTLNRHYQFGIDWSALRRIGSVGLNVATAASTGGVTLSLDSPTDTDDGISVVLDALETQGDVRVLSSPNVAVLNNQRAVFNVATDEVFFRVTRQPVIGPAGTPIGFTTEVEPQQVPVGISLDVMAQISADNTITMNVRPAVTNLVRTESLAIEDGTQATAPVIDRRETDTMVRMRGGETVVIGGLMQTSEENTTTGVPFLRDIPLIGRLFRGVTHDREKRELVVFLTPRIIAGQAPEGGR
jgi:MSHA biogenesis protein MshL